MGGTMNMTLFNELFRLTLVDPRGAGHRVIALGLPPQVLWTALALVAVLFSLSMSAILHSAPMPPDPTGAAIRALPHYSAPLMAALMQWGQMVITVFILFWVGQALGGKGRLVDMLAVMIWLNLVAVVISVVIFVLALVLPPLASLAVLVMLFWVFWATFGMIDAAHRFDNYFMGMLVFILAVVAMAIGMSVFSAVLGLTAMGVS